ncbi:protein CHLOROPLAST IMPORT APPARATUS 2-like [Silene latifolia]|uniref:protein CHLOROPLAST IMPORT APPARATUS 2-like n=1 Tax=Silene latifolia TaxID=37657 RepID=UPI003D784180
MSSCLSGGRRAGYGIDLDIIKSCSNSSRTYHSSSPSSTISESSDSPIATSIRKQRTPRKRPNQTYTEAAALLSTAYPNIFSSDDFSKPSKFMKPHDYSSFCFEDSTDELLIPFPVDKPAFHIDSNDTYDYGCKMISSNLFAGCEDFDAQSILDEETEEGVIDSILGNLDVCPEEVTTTCNNGNGSCNVNVNGAGVPVDFCYGYPVGLGFNERVDYGFGMMRGEKKAFRQNDEGEWWRFPAVNVGQISPQLNKPKSPVKKKKKMMKLNTKPFLTASKENSPAAPKRSSNKIKEELTTNTKLSRKDNSVPLSVPQPSAGLSLNLNYEEVLDAWSDKGSLFSEDLSGSEFSGMDASARLAQIDLFSENGALREASVQRYKEKRQTRLFSKKIRYHVRKVNADQRPRMKGRFVRRPKSAVSEER